MGCPLRLLNSHLTNIVNKSLDDKFSTNAKTALVSPLCKKKDRDKIQNYRPVSILNSFSKIYKQYLLNSLSGFVHKKLSNFTAAYWKSYSSSHVLIRLIENWKKTTRQKKHSANSSHGFIKSTDCIPHDLLIASGFIKNTVGFFYS